MRTCRRLLLAVLLTLIGPRPGLAQEIGAAGAERDMERDQYWRVVYENDFFAATDRDYTQGLLIEWVSTSLQRVPLRRLLVRPRGYTQRWGLAFEDDGYTGRDLKSPRTLPGDRPYAGTKQLRAFTLASSENGARRVTSGLTVGIIGPAAAGEQIQTFLHRVSGNTIPQGWQLQIRNDLLLNYEVELTQRLYRAGRHAELLTHGRARLGSFNTAARVGATAMFGWLDAAYIYATPTLQVTAHDATLQGGLFNRSSPYTIPASQLRQGQYAHRAGIVLRVGGRYVEYFETYADPPFRGARAHRTGGLVIGWPLGR